MAATATLTGKMIPTLSSPTDFHAGHELVIEERLRLADGGATLVYTDLVSGPDATDGRREIRFRVTPKD
jgi:hypothetical protein